MSLDCRVLALGSDRYRRHVPTDACPSHRGVVGLDGMDDHLACEKPVCVHQDASYGIQGMDHGDDLSDSSCCLCVD